MSEKLKWQTLVLIGLVAFVTRSHWYTGQGLEPTDDQLPVIDLTDYFTSWSRLVRDDRDQIQTTGQWRDAYIYASRLLLNDQSYEKVAGRNSAINQILVDKIGLEDRPLDLEIRTILADTLLFIGQELTGGKL